MTEIVVIIILLVSARAICRSAAPRISGEFRSSDIAVAIRKERRWK